MSKFGGRKKKVINILIISYGCNCKDLAEILLDCFYHWESCQFDNQKAEKLQYRETWS